MAENLIFLAIIVFALFFMGGNFIWHRKVECHLWCFFKECKFSGGAFVAVGQSLAIRLEWDDKSQDFKKFRIFELGSKVGDEQIKNILLYKGEWLGKEAGLTRQGCDSDLIFEVFPVYNKQMLTAVPV